MQVVSIPTMVENYQRCPWLAVDDFRILIAGVYRLLGKGTGKDVFPEVRSLASIIAGETESCDKTSDLSSMVDFESELDFKSLNLMSPVDSIRQFREAIEFCCDSPEAALFSKIDLTLLSTLFEQLVDRVGDEEFTVCETLHRVERNLDRFAKAVEIGRRSASDQLQQTTVVPSHATAVLKESCGTVDDGKSAADVRAVKHLPQSTPVETSADSDVGQPRYDGDAGASKQPDNTRRKVASRVSTDARHYDRVLQIVGKWWEHHDSPNGYVLAPMTQTEMETATGIPRRTIGRTVKAMFGIVDQTIKKPWKLYEAQCQMSEEFLKWLDVIIKPSEGLALISAFRTAKAVERKCESCGEIAGELYEWNGREYCSNCYQRR